MRGVILRAETSSLRLFRPGTPLEGADLPSPMTIRMLPPASKSPNVAQNRPSATETNDNACSGPRKSGFKQGLDNLPPTRADIH